MFGSGSLSDDFDLEEQRLLNDKILTKLKGIRKTPPFLDISSSSSSNMDIM